MEPLFLLLLLSSIGGLLTALYIYWKRKHGPLVCMIGESCEDVLQSTYATIFFGIPNEIVGALYFASIIVFLVMQKTFGVFLGQSWSALFLIGTGLGSLYALYLIGIQAFVLKKWCEKCLLLSFFTFLVFLLALSF